MEDNTTRIENASGVKEDKVETLFSSNENFVKEWDFEQGGTKNSLGNNKDVNQRIVLTDERLIVFQEINDGDSYEKKKCSYRLGDIKAVNTYVTRGKLDKKNKVALIVGGLAIVFLLIGIFLLFRNTTTKQGTGVGITSLVGALICVAWGIVLGAVSFLLRKKSETTTYMVVEIETSLLQKSVLANASKMSEGVKDGEIKKIITLPVNEFAMQFANEIDNIIIETQIKK